MAPIYDTDVAEERYSQSEWKHYELWEKVEHRIRRRKWLWIAVTCVLFLLLSSVPVIMERSPRWTSLSAVRVLAQELSRLKREAGSSQHSYRIRFTDSRSLAYVVEKAESCASGSWQAVRAGSLLSGASRGGYQLMDAETGRLLGIPGLIESFCYDYLAGSSLVLNGRTLSGFAVTPVNDLTEKRTDRMALLLLKGPSAEISFE